MIKWGLKEIPAGVFDVLLSRLFETPDFEEGEVESCVLKDFKVKLEEVFGGS